MRSIEKSEVTQLIIRNQAITYAITDRHLRIIEVGGAVNGSNKVFDAGHGKMLLDLVPELIGYEPDIEALLAGRSQRFELSFVNRETEPGQISYTTHVNLPYINNNEISGIVHIAEDVSSIAKAEQAMLQQRNELFLLRDELRKQNQKLQAALVEFQHLDAVKSQFVTIAAHELRNPISTIMLYARALLDDEAKSLSKVNVRHVGVIYRNAERLSRITSNLLDLLKLQIGQIELIIKPLNLAEIVEKIEVDMRPIVREKAQQLLVQAAPDLPMALCDEDRVLQILNNLIHNASKYSPNGSQITIKLFLDDDPNYLHLTICDQGIGIPVEDQPRLFESFFRASNAHHFNPAGSGLGLSIVRSLVELHSGHIWIESELDRGTTVHVLLQSDAN